MLFPRTCSHETLSAGGGDTLSVQSKLSYAAAELTDDEVPFKFLLFSSSSAVAAAVSTSTVAVVL